MRGNSRCLLVFTNLLAHADSTGSVDIHPRSIADEVGLPLDIVKAALIDLENPDPESRSHEQEGRRIIRLDGHRDWGWQIVNYVKYRTIKSEDDRREQNRQAQAKWRAKQSNPNKPDVSSVSTNKHESAQEEAEANTDAKNTEEGENPLANVADVCPHQSIIDLYHQNLPVARQVREWTPTRQTALRARWREKAERQNIEWWEKFFGYVAKSDFLCGRSATQAGRKPFELSLDWLCKSENFVKVLEGAYE